MSDDGFQLIINNEPKQSKTHAVNANEDEFGFSNGVEDVDYDAIPNPDANGGTEAMYRHMCQLVPEEKRKKAQIILSRIRNIDPNRPKIWWLHDLAGDPEVARLQEPGFKDQFSRFVFVSHWQQLAYELMYQLNPNKCIVLKNAINPIEYKPREDDGTIRLIYHTTPHRGLEILVPVFVELAKHYPNVHLDVFSSFSAYGPEWEARNERYQPLFDTCNDHPNIIYHGYQPNFVVREYLQNAHIFAYPSIWKETSCIAAIEAAAAGCDVVCPTLGALPETMAGFATMYHWHSDINVHAQIFYEVLQEAVASYYTQIERWKFQSTYFNAVYNWQSRAAEWVQLLDSLDGDVR